MNDSKNPNGMFSDLTRSGYFYRVKSVKYFEEKPIILFVGCMCEKPKENYPFQQPVFDWLKSISGLIIKFSNRFSVPPIAVAGALADEYNTRFMPDYSLAKKYLDNLQDNIIPRGKFTEYSESINNEWSSDELEKQFNEIKKNDPDNIRRTKWDRFSNLVAGDYGKGNISLRTAYDMYDQKKDDFPQMSRLDILRYLVTDEGTVHFAALSIKDAQLAMADYIRNHPQRKKEAVMVTYFKQGDNYRRKFLNNSLRANSHAEIKSGEGCRTCFQRKEISECIGVSIKTFEMDNE